MNDDELNCMTKRLAASDNYMSRISAIMIYCKMENYFGPGKHKDIMALLTSSGKSEIPNVRKHTAIFMKYFLRNAGKLESEGLGILKVLIMDEMDLIRVFAVESILFKTYDLKAFNSTIWPILKSSFEEISWRVKYSIVNNIGEICNSAGRENVKKLI